MSTNNVMFRTSVGGYNKKDVYRYIDEANREVMKRIEEYENIIREKDLQIASLQAAEASWSEKESVLSSDLKAAADKTAMLEEQIREAKEIAEKKRAEAEEKDMQFQLFSFREDQMEKEASAMRRSYEELRAQCEQLTQMLDGYDVIRRKADGYDRIAERLHTIGQSQSAQSDNESVKVPAHEEKKEETPSLLALRQKMQELYGRFSKSIEHLEQESEAMKEKLGSILYNTEVDVIKEMSRTDTEE